MGLIDNQCLWNNKTSLENHSFLFLIEGKYEALKLDMYLYWIVHYFTHMITSPYPACYPILFGILWGFARHVIGKSNSSKTYPFTPKRDLFPSLNRSRRLLEWWLFPFLALGFHFFLGDFFVHISMPHWLPPPPAAHSSLIGYPSLRRWSSRGTAPASTFLFTILTPLSHPSPSRRFTNSILCPVSCFLRGVSICWVHFLVRIAAMPSVSHHAKYNLHIHPCKCFYSCIFTLNLI